MRKAWISLVAAGVLAVAATPLAAAGQPARFEVPFTILFPDTNLGLVVLINMDRETYCTPEIVAWEEAWIAWIEGGEVGDPPADPTFPDGFDPISVQESEAGQGALISMASAAGLSIELWEIDADPPLVGPCTDTDDADHLVASGTVAFRSNDNDVFGSGTRGNAFGDRGIASLESDDGTAYRYSWLFHVNSRCYSPDDGPPACLVETSSLRAH